MKTVILAGGLGTRISEETTLRPKPMIEVGGRPILLHIIDIYSSQGFNEFVICLGYRGYMIKEYFQNYLLHLSDVTFDFTRGGEMLVHRSSLPPWKVTLVETGDNTQTGGRLARARRYIGEERFMLTYGDGVADIDLRALVARHESHGRLATITAVQPPGRFGALVLGEEGHVERFQEKPLGDHSWINGGFFVLESGVFDYLGGDEVVLEREPLERLAADRQLGAFKHDGFWWAMDTLRDKRYLDALCEGRRPPWSK
jgi:glucose-1-phosphate cytidylyltransferase